MIVRIIVESWDGLYTIKVRIAEFLPFLAVVELLVKRTEIPAAELLRRDNQLCYDLCSKTAFRCDCLIFAVRAVP